MASAWRQIYDGLILQSPEFWVVSGLGEDIEQYLRMTSCVFREEEQPNLVLDTGEARKLVLTLKPPY